MSHLSAKAVMAGALLHLLAAAGPSAAQTNIETNAPGIQLNLSTPGARSLALGGTFLGRADDATSAYANPAGLANLPRREASLELRSWGYTHVFTNRGRLDGSPTGIGPDDTPGLVDGESADGVLGASFASFVIPRRPWAVAVYFHTLADFEANFRTEGAFVSGQAPFPQRLFPVESRSRVEILNLGVSASYRVTRDLSVGLGVSHYRFKIDSTLDRFFLPSRNGPPDFFFEFDDPARELQNRQTQQGTDSDLGLTLGVLWRVSPRWQVGGVYRQGPSFDFRAVCSMCQRAQDPTDILSSEARFNVPDQWGVGVMWQASEQVILGLDFYRIGYSALAEGFTDVFGRGEEEFFTANDGNEIHAGLEYLLGNLARPVWLRMGAWYDPEHGIRTLDGAPLADQAIFRPRGGLMHWAAGVGTVGRSYQLDLGVDYSERTVTVSVSTVVRF